MTPRHKAAIGIDVGGTCAKLAAVACEASGRRGRLLSQTQIPSQPEKGPAAFIKNLGEVIDSWTQQRGLRPAALGLGLAGDVDGDAGLLRYCPNLPGWENFNFKEALKRRFKKPVIVGNDANLAVWGGYVTELKKRPANVIGVTLGTGVGGGLIIAGRLYRGATGSAGEIGHMRVASPGQPCHCGLSGCLEAYAGSYGILRTARQILARNPRGGGILREICPDLEDINPSHISAAAERGDALAREIWSQTARYLAIGLSNLVMVLNPDVLLVLGGISRAGKWLTEPIDKFFQTQPFKAPFQKVKLKLADNPNAGCVGAALLAMERARRE